MKKGPILTSILSLLFIMTACSSESKPSISDNLPPESAHPTLADYWAGHAEFQVDTVDSGLPMGESNTVQLETGELWSYIHASQQSAAVHDQCGAPVLFPGCVILHTSQDNGQTFAPLIEPSSDRPICLFPCQSCPCESVRDHIDQQQYPQVVRHITELGQTTWIMAYEYRATVVLRYSNDGLQWSVPTTLPLTGIWQRWLTRCQSEEAVQSHPHMDDFYQCLIGGPPGLFIANNELYIFVGLGQNPGHMGCYRGPISGPASLFRKCDHNPLLIGAHQYGPANLTGAEANPYFDFRTVSSANLLQVGQHYYMLYEGVRGPATGEAGDTQFGLGLARSQTNQIDGPWEPFPDNPILVDLPGNVGLGHADLLIIDGQTILYTSLDGVTRSRLVLKWIDR